MVANRESAHLGILPFLPYGPILLASSPNPRPIAFREHPPPVGADRPTLLGLLLAPTLVVSYRGRLAASPRAARRPAA